MLAMTQYSHVKKNICERMVPYRDWAYFEGFRELLIELRCYMEEQHGENYAEQTHFPQLKEIKKYNPRLHALTLYYGGRKFVAIRVGLKHSTRKPSGEDVWKSIDWGPLDLDFAIELMNYIRDDHMKRDPPLPAGKAEMCMPTPEQLRNDSMSHLDSKICKYGGYENIARRLQLSY